MDEPKPRWDEDFRLIEKTEAVDESVWSWRNLRSCAFGFRFWPIEWHLSFIRLEDRWGGEMAASVGPFEFSFAYNDGSAMKWLHARSKG